MYIPAGNARVKGRAGMQTSSQVADLGGQPRVGQVHGHAINPPVQPQPAATATIAGQLLEESPAPAGQAG